MEQKTNDFLEKQPVGVLMKKYAVPCVISLLVAALYNIVDQLFIANASYPDCGGYHCKNLSGTCTIGAERNCEKS